MFAVILTFLSIRRLNYGAEAKKERQLQGFLFPAGNATLPPGLAHHTHTASAAARRD